MKRNHNSRSYQTVHSNMCDIRLFFSVWFAFTIHVPEIVRELDLHLFKHLIIRAVLRKQIWPHKSRHLPLSHWSKTLRMVMRKRRRRKKNLLCSGMDPYCRDKTVAMWQTYLFTTCEVSQIMTSYVILILFNN